MSATRPRQITGRSLLRAYLRIGLFISLIVAATGIATLLTALMSYIVGFDFSYYASTPMPASYPSPPMPVPLQPDQRSLDIVHGLTAAVIAIIFVVVHSWGIRSAETTSERRESTLSRLSAVAGAVAFGLVAIISLVEGVSATLSRILVSGSHDQPGSALSTGLVFGAGWAWFIVTVIRQLRHSEPSAPEPS